MAYTFVAHTVTVYSHGLYSYGQNRSGLYSFGLYRFRIYMYGLYSYVYGYVCSYGLGAATNLTLRCASLVRVAQRRVDRELICRAALEHL